MGWPSGIAWFGSLKTNWFPASSASSFVETVDDPEPEKVSESYLKAMSYYGPVEIEYKTPRTVQNTLSCLEGAPHAHA